MNGGKAEEVVSNMSLPHCNLNTLLIADLRNGRKQQESLTA